MSEPGAAATGEWNLKNINRQSQVDPAGQASGTLALQTFENRKSVLSDNTRDDFPIQRVPAFGP